MKKYILILLTIIIFILFPKSSCIAEDEATDSNTVNITPILEESLNGIDFSSWQNFIDENIFFNEISGKESIKDFIIKLINGKATISFAGLTELIFSDFSKSMKSHMSIAYIILGLAILSIIAEKFGNSIFKGNIISICLNIIFIAALSIIIKSFSEILSSGIACISQMSSFTEKALPILTVFITAIGGASAEVLQPSTLIVVDTTTKIIHSIIIPLITASAVLCAAHRICSRNIFSELSSSVNKLNSWIIGLMFTLFFGFISIQKLTSSALDGASIKTIKYTISSFSLYGGSFLSKSFDIVTGCSVMMKSILGGISMVILLCICIAPALKICAVSIIYRFIAIIIGALGENRICGCLNDIGKIYGVLFLAVMTCAILMFAVLSVIAVTGSTLLG